MKTVSVTDRRHGASETVITLGEPTRDEKDNTFPMAPQGSETMRT
jgi:hypothetical protein